MANLREGKEAGVWSTYPFAAAVTTKIRGYFSFSFRNATMRLV
jgi:hypothetical protein